MVSCLLVPSRLLRLAVRKLDHLPGAGRADAVEPGPGAEGGVAHDIARILRTVTVPSSRMPPPASTGWRQAQASDQRYQELFEHASDAIFVLTRRWEGHRGVEPRDVPA